MSEKEEKNKKLIKENINKKLDTEGQNLYDELWKMESIECKASEVKKEFYKNVRRSAF